MKSYWVLAFLKFWLTYKGSNFFFLLSSFLLTDILLAYKIFPFLIPKTIIKFPVPLDTWPSNKKYNLAPPHHTPTESAVGKAVPLLLWYSLGDFGKSFSPILSHSWNFSITDSFLCICQTSWSFCHSLLKIHGNIWKYKNLEPVSSYQLKPTPSKSPLETKAGGIDDFGETSTWTREKWHLSEGEEPIFACSTVLKRWFLFWGTWSRLPKLPRSLIP